MDVARRRDASRPDPCIVAILVGCVGLTLERPGLERLDDRAKVVPLRQGMA